MIPWQLLPSLLGGNVKPPEAKEYIPPDKRPTGGGLGSIFSMLPHVVAGMQGGNLGGEAKHVLKGVMSGDFNRALPSFQESYQQFKDYLVVAIEEACQSED